MEIKTKYNIGDEVYFIHNNKVNNSRIKSIEVTCISNYDALYPTEPKVVITYHVMINNTRYCEYDLFKTKEELINSL